MPIDTGLEDVWVPDALDRVVEVADLMAVFAAQRLARIDAMRVEALRDAARLGRVLTEVVERGVRLELAAALRITEHAAGSLLWMAEALVHRYPAVGESLERARVTERHVEILVAAIDPLDVSLRDRVLPDALALAEAQPIGRFRRELRRLIDDACAASLDARHEDALAGRRVVVEHVDDGMAWLHLLAPAVEVHAIHDRISRLSKVIVAVEGESRTLDQVRADAVCDLLIDGSTGLHPDEARGVRASVVVTVPALALLQAGDQERDAAGLVPAAIEGLGPIPLRRAKELCGDAAGWTRVLTHPETGVVLSVGRDRYRPPPALRKLVRWRADRCMAPGCGIPASRCELDHTIAWEQGGTTAVDNLAPLCKGHHTVKHHGGWRVRQVPDSGGALEWASPAGRRYVVQPERRIPVFRPSGTSDGVTVGAQSDAPF